MTAQGEAMISTTNQRETPQPAVNAAAKPTKKARVAPRRANVAPTKPKVGKKASRHAKKARKGAKKATDPRHGTKAAKIIDLLRQPGGVTSKELQRASSWQPHSIRGFLSGTIRKKMGLTVSSVEGEDGERRYSVEP
jgi:hypothetical protein